jgi:uncharacterized membrane protein
MSALEIVIFVLLGVVILFFGWVWFMNRLDERRERSARADARTHRGVP